MAQNDRADPISDDGRTRRAEEQRRSRRAHILETALDVFSTRGYHATRVADIIDAAGVSRGTFYLYFESKSAIFVELLEGLLTHLRANIVGVETAPGSPPLEEQLVAMVALLLDTVLKNRRLTAIIVRQSVGVDAEVDRILAEFYGNLRAFVIRSLEQGQQLGVVRPLDNEVVAFCMLGTVKQVMEHFVADGATSFLSPPPGRALDVERIGRALLDFNLRGVLQRGPIA